MDTQLSAVQPIDQLQEVSTLLVSQQGCAITNFINDVTSAAKGSGSFLQKKSISLFSVNFSEFQFPIFQLLSSHGDVMTCKHFLYYWPFVKEIHWSPAKGSFDVLFVVSLIDLLTKQTRSCFETPCLSCDITVIHTFSGSCFDCLQQPVGLYTYIKVTTVHLQQMDLTHKQLIIHACVLSTVVTDALALKDEAISSRSAD